MPDETSDVSQAKLLREGIEADTIAYIEDCRLRAANAQNSVYVWRALNKWFAVNRARQRVGADPIPMPPWCLPWLAIFAQRISDLT